MRKKYVDIFQYEDFRKFLKDYQINRKKVDGDFTLAKISVLCGMPNNRGYYGDIVNGKSLSLVYTEKMVKILKLKYNEAMYFRLLVHYDRSLNVDERKYFKKKLDEIRKKKSS